MDAKLPDATAASPEPVDGPAITRRRFLTRGRNLLIVAGAAGIAGKFGFDWLISDGPRLQSLPSWLKSTPIAHRGRHDAKAAVPENSLLAFERAVQAGFPIELDVHSLRDDKLAVIHDDDLFRMTGRAGTAESLSSTEISARRLQETSQHVPLLEEVLQLVAGKVPILIETKARSRTDRRLEKLLAKYLDAYSGPVAVQSFNPFSMEWFSRHRPDVVRGQLACDFRDEKVPSYQKWLLRNLYLTRLSRPAFINYDIRCLPHWAVQNKRRLGLTILGWTARSEQEAAAARRWVDNIVFEGFTPTGATATVGTAPA